MKHESNRRRGRGNKISCLVMYHRGKKDSSEVDKMQQKREKGSKESKVRQSYTNKSGKREVQRVR